MIEKCGYAWRCSLRARRAQVIPVAAMQIRTNKTTPNRKKTPAIAPLLKEELGSPKQTEQAHGRTKYLI